MSRPLPLFSAAGLLSEPIVAPINVPDVVDHLMRHGAALAISISGGKDSQAMLQALCLEYNLRNWTGPLFAIHAHLGRIEWHQSLPHCKRIVEKAGIELIVVRREKGNGELVERWRERMMELKGTGKPHWSSAQNRYCTSDSKRTPIDKYLRRFELVISAEGLRAEESDGRAAKSVVSIREQITSSSIKNLSIEAAIKARPEGRRLALNWYPILDWKIEQVWNACGTSGVELDFRRKLYRDGRKSEALEGWPAHEAYVFGNNRVSCIFCILGSTNDLSNGARHRPELLAELVAMEQESGFTFKSKMSLASLEAR